MVVDDENSDRQATETTAKLRKSATTSEGTLTDDARERIQKLIVTGDNRLKQGVAPEKVRATYEEALEVAREAGLEERVRALVELRLADLERLAGGSPPPAPPDA